jgi:hypothetical protein
MVCQGGCPAHLNAAATTGSAAATTASLAKFLRRCFSRDLKGLRAWRAAFRQGRRATGHVAPPSSSGAMNPDPEQETVVKKNSGRGGQHDPRRRSARRKASVPTSS